MSSAAHARQQPPPAAATSPELFVVLGGGVTGLTAALELQKVAGRRVVVLESAPDIGGLAASFKSGAQVFDYGSHRIHEQYDREALALIRDLLGSELLKMPRRGQIRIQGRFVNYPPSVLQILGAFGAAQGVRFAIDYALATVLRFIRPGKPRNFEEYSIAHVGRSLYERFYRPYARKLWNTDPTAVAIDPAMNRVKKFELGQVARELAKRLRLRPTEHYFYYPARGFGQIARGLEERALAAGIEVVKGARIDRLARAEDGRVRALTARLPSGEDLVLEPSALVSTIPIDALDRMLRVSEGETQPEASGLRWRSLRILYLLTPAVVPSLHETYYFPEPDVTFGRVSEIGKYSPHLKPVGGRTALAIEVPCTEGDELWSLSDADLAARCLTDLKATGIVRGDARIDDAEYFSRRVRNIYPLHLIGWRDELKRVLQRAFAAPNVFPIGRSALFLHCNVDHCIVMALRLARFLAQGDAASRRSDWLRESEAFFDFRIRD